MVKRVLVLTLASVVLSGSIDTAYPWSEEGVRLFLEKAVKALDNPLKRFYEDRELTLVETASDPSLFPPRLLFEVDRLEPFPFLDHPTDRKRAVRK